jgi:hypothetical protein
MQREKIQTLQEAAAAGLDVEKLEAATVKILEESFPKDAYKYLEEDEGLSHALAKAIVIRASSKIRKALNIPDGDEFKAIEAIKKANWDHEGKKVSLVVKHPIHIRAITDRIAHDYEINITVNKKDQQ